MSDNALIERIEALSMGADFTNPETYADLLGYGQPEQASEAQAAAPQAETATAAEQPAAPAPAAQPDQTAAQAGNSAPAGAVEANESDGVAGVATKDGKRVIPYDVLAQTRTAKQEAEQRERQLAEANQRLVAELEALKNGQSTAASQAQAQAAADPISDDELQEIEADIPVVGKLAKAYRQLSQQLETVKQQVQAPQQAATQATEAARIQELIDQRPLLAQWQARGGMAWQSAVALDAKLQADPAWVGKSEAERFAQVERLIADDFGIQMPSQQPAPQATTAAPAAATTAARAAAPVEPAPAALPTLTDLAGRGVASADPLKGLSGGQAVDVAMSMSLEDLRRMAGLTY
jgi:hypothetical protein